MIKNNIDVVNGAVPSGEDGYAWGGYKNTTAKDDAGWNASSSDTETVTQGTNPAVFKAGNGLM